MLAAVRLAAELVTAVVVLVKGVGLERAIWGPEAYRFPQRGIGVENYRERLHRAGIDPDTIGAEIAAALSPRTAPVPAGAGAPAHAGGDDPTENPAHYLRLLDELHDNGVLESDEYQTARTRLLERLRA